MKFFISFLFFVVTISIYSQGLILTPQDVLNATDPIEMDIAGFGTNIPSSHNMLKYAPPTLTQSGGTCVGFSTAYCAQSTMMNKASNTTMPLHKYVLCMDPYLLYSVANTTSPEPCESGMDFANIFKMLNEIGNKRDMMPPLIGCDFKWHDSNGNLDKKTWNQTLDASMPFRIEKYGPIDLNRSDWIVGIKQFLSNDIPVVIGAEIKDDFSPASYGGSIKANGVYEYAASPGEGGGHAMCILGYDDNKVGGAFLIRNSWGNGFGINGDFWLRYLDFKSLVVEAWVIIPENWTENIYSSDDYYFNFKSTGIEGLEYGRADWQSSVYEGFYMKDYVVFAYELFDNGGIYFGQYLNYRKHGYGVYWDSEGVKYNAQFRHGELVQDVAGFASSQTSDIVMPEEIRQIINNGTPSMEFLGNFPISGYSGE